MKGRFHNSVQDQDIFDPKLPSGGFFKYTGLSIIGLWGFAIETHIGSVVNDLVYKLKYQRIALIIVLIM